MALAVAASYISATLTSARKYDADQEVSTDGSILGE